MKTLGRLVRYLLVVIIVLVVFKLFSNRAAKPPTQISPTSTRPVSELMPVPAGFTAQADNVVPPGTEVKGVGTVDQGFAFVGAEKVEFITGYTIKIPPAIGPEGFKLQIRKPELILDVVLLGLKAVGVNDKKEMPGLTNIGEESIGVTFTTHWNNTKLRVDGVVFRRGAIGAIAAVVYVDGQQPSVLVADVAKNLDIKIK